MPKTTCRLLLSLSLGFLVFNVASVAGDGFLDQINTESVADLLSSGSFDDAKKAMSAASPDEVQGAVKQFAASASANSDDVQEALKSIAQSPAEGPGDYAATSPESSEGDGEEDKGVSSWKKWVKAKMQNMGYGYGESPAGSPEAAPGPAWGPTSPGEWAWMDEAPMASPTGSPAEAPTT
ncbi:hypothetical protein LINPERHAP2_LOCUS25121 [Linum perenne]